MVRNKQFRHKAHIPKILQKQEFCQDSIGIGLPLAKSIIERNNGYIEVTSEEGKGTTFTIKYLK